MKSEAIFIRDCQADLRKCGIKITLAQVVELVGIKTSHMKWLRKAVKGYDLPAASPPYGLDTMERDALFDHVAVVFTKYKRWPCNCDDYGQKFFKALMKGLKKKGIKICS
jgi:hypothetical protein